MNTWRNWLGNVSSTPRARCAPASTAEVAACLERAARRNERVRAVGAGYAWSPLVPVDGTLLSMERMRAIRHVDPGRRRITVEAGATVREVVDVAARHGMSVSSPSMFMGLSVGGLIATGSHGTGRHAATFGDAAADFEMVLPDGSVRTVTDPGSPLWRAALCNLGALGVVTAVTLQCQPAFNVHEVHAKVDIEEVAAQIPAMLAENEFVELFWVAPSRKAKFKLGNRTSRPAEAVAGRRHPTAADRVRAGFGPALPHLAKLGPFVDPLAHMVYDSIGTGVRVVSGPDFAHYNQAYPRCISSEFGIPVERAPEAWRWLQGRLRRYGDAGVRPVSLVVHARFCRASRALIAPSSGRDTCHLEVLSFKGNEHRHLFGEDFDVAMRGRFCGRPHWGKEIHNPAAATENYGDELAAFLELRHELDPRQRFLNAFLRDDVFGLARRPKPAARRARVSEAPAAGAAPSLRPPTRVRDSIAAPAS